MAVDGPDSDIIHQLGNTYLGVFLFLRFLFDSGQRMRVFQRHCYHEEHVKRGCAVFLILRCEHCNLCVLIIFISLVDKNVGSVKRQYIILDIPRNILPNVHLRLAARILVEYLDVIPIVRIAERQNPPEVMIFHTTVLELILEPQCLGIAVHWIHDT